jgi:hypothetical protein
MGGGREGACGAVVSRRIGGRVWRLAILPGRVWRLSGDSKDATPTISALLRFAVLPAGGGWGEFKAGGFFLTDGDWQSRLVGEGKNGEWADFFGGTMGFGGKWTVGGTGAEPPRFTIFDLRSEMTGRGILGAGRGKDNAAAGNEGHGGYKPPPRAHGAGPRGRRR